MVLILVLGFIALFSMFVAIAGPDVAAALRRKRASKKSLAEEYGELPDLSSAVGDGRPQGMREFLATSRYLEEQAQAVTMGRSRSIADEVEEYLRDRS